MKSRAFLHNIALVLISSFLGLLLLEGSLRVYGITGDQGRLSSYEFDNQLGWRTKKRASYFRSTAAYGHFTYYDADGFPTDERGQNGHRIGQRPGRELRRDQQQGRRHRRDRRTPHQARRIGGRSGRGCGFGDAIHDAYLSRKAANGKR